LAVKTGYGRTVSNVHGTGILNDGSSYRKTARPETCVDTGTNNTQKSVKYKTGHNVSVLSEGKQARQWTQFCR